MLLTPNKEHKKIASRWHLYDQSLCSWTIKLTFPIYVFMVCFQSRWPNDLRRTSEAVWLLGLRVRIPLKSWMFVCFVCFVLCCVGNGLCDELITRSEGSTELGCVCLNVCYLETSTMNRPRP